MKEDSIEKYRDKLKKSVGESYTALEDSDNYLKYYAVTSASPFLNGIAYVITAIYKNNYVTIQAMDYKLAEKILYDLGFPKGKQIKDSGEPTGRSDSDTSEASDSSEDSGNSDTQEETSENNENAEDSEQTENNEDTEKTEIQENAG